MLSLRILDSSVVFIKKKPESNDFVDLISGAVTALGRFGENISIDLEQHFCFKIGQLTLQLFASDCFYRQIKRERRRHKNNSHIQQELSTAN